MIQDQETPPPPKSRGVPVVIFWLVFSISGNLYRLNKMGSDLILSPSATLEVTYIACALICSLGLLLRQEWARKLTIMFFALYFCFAIFTANLVGAETFNQIVEQQHVLWSIDLETVKMIFLTVLILYILWPMIVVFYLSYPTVKDYFNLYHRKKNR